MSTNDEPKKWTKDEVRQMVTTNQLWTERAIVVLYDYQTDDEKSDEVTKHENNVGFSGTDAYILSEYARWIHARKHLTPKQLKLAQKRIGKYAGQLLRIINSKQSE